MSVKIMSLVWERAPYTSGSLLVLLALADWANDEGVAWPSMDRLAEKARMEPRSTQRIVRQLQKEGALIVEEGGGRGRQHRYHIQIETLTNCHPLAEKTLTPTSPIAEIKGDIYDTETVTSDAQRVTFEAERVTPTSPDPLEEPLARSVRSDPLVLNPPFSSPEFLSALSDFEQHRKEIRKPLKDTGRKLIYKQIQAMGESRAIIAIEHSITHNWQSIFEPNGNGNATNKHNPPGQRSSGSDYVFKPKSIVR